MKYFKEVENTLQARFEFEGFSEALEFVNGVGAMAEKQNHHPDIFLHDYKFVGVFSTTHDKSNTVTRKDFLLAEELEKLYKEKF